MSGSLTMSYMFPGLAQLVVIPLAEDREDEHRYWRPTLDAKNCYGLTLWSALLVSEMISHFMFKNFLIRQIHYKSQFQYLNVLTL